MRPIAVVGITSDYGVSTKTRKTIDDQYKAAVTVAVCSDTVRAVCIQTSNRATVGPGLEAITAQSTQDGCYLQTWGSTCIGANRRCALLSRSARLGTRLELVYSPNLTPVPLASM